MDYIYWLIIVAVIIVCGNLIAWLMRKRNTPATFTGNVDNSGQTDLPSKSSRSDKIPGTVETALRALLASGKKIEAIKRVREQTGLGLKEAKDLVEALERDAAVSIHTHVHAPASFSDLDGQLRKLITEGKLIDAIKLVRNQKNLGLKEAKDYVERL